MPNSYKNSNHRLFLLFIWLLFFVGNQIIYANNAEYAVEGTFGEFGERAGQFNYPVGIALDKNGNIFISDWENDRIQVFDSTEKYIFTIPDEASNVKLDGPVGIVLDNEDNILVVEQHNHRIHKISPDGHSIMVFGQSGNKPGEFDNPRGIALDKDGNIYVVDTGNSRVQVFSPNFELLFTFGREGMGDGEFYYPRGIALDKDGNIYVADTFHHQIQVFNDKGQFIKRFGSSGSGPSEFNGTRYIAIDKNDNIYVTDYRNGKIVQFDRDYNFVSEFGANDSGVTLTYPEGITIDQRGYVYVADAGNNRIVKYITSKIIISKKQGIEAIENKEWDEAIQSLQKTLEEDSKDIDSRKAIAFAYFESGQLEEAIQEYNLILKEYPQDQNINFKLVEAHFLLATQLVKEKRYKEALNHFKVVLKKEPNYPDIKTTYYLTLVKYLYNSLYFKAFIIIIPVLLVILLIAPKLSRKKGKRSKHFRTKDIF